MLDRQASRARQRRRMRYNRSALGHRGSRGRLLLHSHRDRWWFKSQCLHGFASPMSRHIGSKHARKEYPCRRQQLQL